MNITEYGDAWKNAWGEFNFLEVGHIKSQRLTRAELTRIADILREREITPSQIHPSVPPEFIPHLIKYQVERVMRFEENGLRQRIREDREIYDGIFDPAGGRFVEILIRRGRKAIRIPADHPLFGNLLRSIPLDSQVKAHEELDEISLSHEHRHLLTQGIFVRLTSGGLNPEQAALTIWDLYEAAGYHFNKQQRRANNHTKGNLVKAWVKSRNKKPLKK